MNNKKFILLYLSILLIFLLFTFFSTIFLFELDHKKSDLILESEYKLENKYLEFKIFPRNVGNDLFFLSKLSSFKSFINSNISSDVLKFNVENDFKNFLGENDIFYQVRFIDNNGIEKIKIQNKNSVLEIIDNSKFQNKSHKDYFINTIKLNQREVYMSKLDLNVEYGEFDKINIDGKSYYVPILRYATPIYDENNISKGIIIINMYADLFLNSIRNENSNFNKMYLINNEGFYLANSQREKEFGNILNTNYNIYTDYSSLPNDLFSEKSLPIDYETKNKYFRFKYLYPTLRSFEIHKGSNKIYGNNSDENYFLILVNVINKSN